MWMVYFHLNPFTWVTNPIFNYLFRTRGLIRAAQSYSRVELEWTSLSLLASLLPLTQQVCSSPQGLVQPLCSRERETLRTLTPTLLRSTKSPLCFSLLLNELLKDKVKNCSSSSPWWNNQAVLQKGYYWKNGGALGGKKKIIVEAI